MLGEILTMSDQHVAIIIYAKCNDQLGGKNTDETVKLTRIFIAIYFGRKVPPIISTR